VQVLASAVHGRVTATSGGDVYRALMQTQDRAMDDEQEGEDEDEYEERGTGGVTQRAGLSIANASMASPISV